MQDYEVNKSTLAIIPCGNNISLVYDGVEMIVVNDKPNNIIKKNCLRFGSSFEGRKKGTESITGVTYKAPILVSETKKLIFFPTSSPRLKSVAWVNLMNVEKTYYNVLKKVSVIEFNNGVFIEFNVSLNIINNQILKSIRLEHFIKKNSKQNA